jgi:hypothetical protein
MYNHHQPLAPQFNSSTLVLAEIVQEERLARKNYSALLKSGNANKKEINQALNEWKKLEGQLDNLLYNVIARPRVQNARERIGGGIMYQ